MRNESTRPSVSTIVVAPGNYGWQAEQVVTVISLRVERVFMTVPHAQVMVASSYFGWMSLFMILLIRN